MLSVEIIYIGEDQSVCHVCLRVAAGATVQHTIEQSGVLAYISAETNPSFAIFGHIVQPTTAVKNGDRIEILRPLAIDPMAKRRLRAQKQSSPVS